MANISERLQVLYGDTARMTIDSHEGKGTLVRIRLPLLQAAGAVPAAFTKSAPRPAGKGFVLGNDSAGAEAGLCDGARRLAHSAQRTFVTEKFDGVACHRIHVAHVAR